MAMMSLTERPEVLRHVLSSLLLTHPGILFTLFQLSVNIFANIQLLPLHVTTQVETSQGSQTGL